MSVLTRTKVFSIIVSLLVAPAVFAAFPPARTQARMAYDPLTRNTILFGGGTALDTGTGRFYQFNDTWLWNGVRWFERFPETSPPPRAAHVMVTMRDRIVVFGGKNDILQIGDTWVYQNEEWHELHPLTSPSARFVAGATYDPIRDRIVMFGGQATTVEGRNTVTTNLFDTWEFDGINWTRVQASGPQVSTPTLVYDEARHQVLMIGMKSDGATEMYVYNPADGTWSVPEGLDPATLPPCGNEVAMTYLSHSRTVLLVGGLCQSSGFTDEAWEWDGTKWTKITTTIIPDRAFGQALAYDPVRHVAIIYGGTSAFTVTRSGTWFYRDRQFQQYFDQYLPAPRSLFTFNYDPANDVAWLYGGVNESGTFGDLWRVRGGNFLKVPVADTPSCVAPVSAFDTDRNKLVIICAGSDVHELDGKIALANINFIPTDAVPTPPAAWKSFLELKTKPRVHKYASAAYDPTLKKTVFFGGFDDIDYLGHTWTWDGVQWTEVKKSDPPDRSLASMWYDPISKKVLLYGGIGRPTRDDRIERYSDMWAFDGSRWNELKVQTPGPRYGAQVGVDPLTGRTLLFGGLRLNVDSTGRQSQVYANDTWEWNGTAWTQLQSGAAPPRENGGLTWDPGLRRLLIFGGWSGFFRTDAWTFNGTTWEPREEIIVRRRRGGR